MSVAHFLDERFIWRTAMMEDPDEFNVNFRVILRDSGSGLSNYDISLHFEDHFS